MFRKKKLVIYISNEADEDKGLISITNEDSMKRINKLCIKKYNCSVFTCSLSTDPILKIGFITATRKKPNFYSCIVTHSVNGYDLRLLGKSNG